VILPLLGESPVSLTIANRSVARALELRHAFAAHGNLSARAFEELAGEQFDVVINATSASLAGEAVAIPPGIYAPGSTAYDMMYGKGLTPFLTGAQSQGATDLADGLGMLVEQAAESFLLWRGIRPDTRPLLAELAAEMRRA
jgi:shikimate dehydrogenase